MSTYARIQDGVVAELVEFDPAGLFNPSLTWVTCDDTPGVAEGWIYTGTKFAPPVAPTQTAAQQAAALLAGGLSVTSAATPALNATSPADAATQAKLAALEVRIAAGLGFPGGATELPWKDSAGEWHPLTVAQFTVLASTISAFVAACDLVADGYPGATLPPATAAIP